MPALRACMWNIQLGIRLPTILRQIAQHPDFHQLDLICLQEASVHQGLEDAAVIARMLGPTYRHYQVSAHVTRSRDQANAIVWDTARIQVQECSAFNLTRVQDLGGAGLEKRLLTRLSYGRRMSVSLDGRFEGCTVRVYSAHLDVFGYEHKRAQLATIFQDIERRGDADLCIVGGDFNTVRLLPQQSWSQMFAPLVYQGFHDTTGKIRWTHSALALRQKLDHIYARASYPMQYRTWTADLPGSDHRPIFAEFLLSRA